MNVRVTKRAQAQIDRAALWWDENRDRAPEAFDEDLVEAFLLLSAEPGVGAAVLHTRAQGVRRLHLSTDFPGNASDFRTSSCGHGGRMVMVCSRGLRVCGFVKP